MPNYTAQVPLATQAINQTQAPIQTNFQSLQQLIDINHVDFSDSVNFGKHSVLSLLVSPNSPPLTGVGPANAFLIAPTVGGDVGFYNYINNTGNTATGLNEIFANIVYKISGSPFVAQQQIPITASSLSSATPPVNGWSLAPSGMIIQWGQFSAGTSPTAPIMLPITFPNNAYIIFAQTLSPNAPQTLSSAFVNKASFTVTSTTSSVNAGKFFAIGY